MNTNSPKTSSLGKLRCKISGHSYVVTHRITNSLNEYQCKHCKEEFSENATGHLVRLTPTNREINACLSDFFTRRSRRRIGNLTQSA